MIPNHAKHHILHCFFKYPEFQNYARCIRITVFKEEIDQSVSTLSAFSPWVKKNLKEKEHILPKCVEYIQNILGGMVKGLHVFWGIEKSSFFKKIEIHSIQGLKAITRHGVTRKRSTKRLKYTGNLVRKKLQLKDDC